MHHFTKFVSSLLCCFTSSERETGAQERSYESPIKESPTSIALPASNVPNALTSSKDLQRIFATSSTPSGYNAAKEERSKRLIPQGSLDLAFQFNSLSPLQRASASVEQLSTHLRQRFSKSRLSKSSSKDDATDLRSLAVQGSKFTDESNQLLAVSQRSTGLSDILASRAASEGGYDSDAKSIQVPLTRGNAGTFRISPGHLRKSLKTVGMGYGTNSDAGEAAGNSGNHESALHLTPPASGTPRRISIVQLKTVESPTDALHRVSLNALRDNLNQPETQELQGLKGCETTRHLSLSAPRRSSSLRAADQSISRTLQILGQREDEGKEPEIKANPKQRVSLLSGIDIDLLGSIQHFIDEGTLDDDEDTDPPQTAIKQTAGNQSLPTPVHFELTSPSEHNLASCRSPTISLQPSNHSSARSLHLFDMQISQRLANTSKDNTDSVTPSHSSTSQSAESQTSEKSRSEAARRYPTFISLEHNRCPSDPSTRRIFEGSKEDFRLRPVGSNVLSTSNLNKQASGTRPSYSRDDTSSVYSNQITNFDGSEVLPVSSSIRSFSSNRHSAAIGGRSVSNPTHFRPKYHDKDAGAGRQTCKPTLTGPILGPVTACRDRRITLPLVGWPSSNTDTPTPKQRRDTVSLDSNEGMSYEEIRPRLYVRQSDIEVRSTNTSLNEQDEIMSQIEYSAPQRAHQSEQFLAEEQSPEKDQVQFHNLVPLANKSSSHAMRADALSTRSDADPDLPPVTPSDTICLDELKESSWRGNAIQRASRTSLRSLSEETKPSQKALVFHLRRKSQSTGDLQSITNEPHNEKAVLNKKPAHLKLKGRNLRPVSSEVMKPTRLKRISLHTLTRKLSSASILSNAILSQMFGPRSTRRQVEPSIRSDKEEDENESVNKEAYNGVDGTRAILRLEVSKKRSNRQFLKRKIKDHDVLIHGSKHLMKQSNRTRNQPYIAHDQDTDTFAAAGDPSPTYGITTLPIVKGRNWRSNVPQQSMCYLDGTVEGRSRSDSLPGTPGPSSQGLNQDKGPEWTNIYTECVGSLTALQSSNEIDSLCDRKQRFLNLTPALRDSTVSFDMKLQQQAEMVKAKLRKQLEDSSNEGVQEPDDAAEEVSGLRMPGSFD